MIFRSQEADVPIPSVPVHEYVLRYAERLPGKPALIDGPSGRTLTYSQLAGAVRAFASGLAARGFKKGDVFAIFCPNLPEYAVAFMGVSAAGGINTTANPLCTADELAKQLGDCKARFLLTVPPFLEKAREAAAKCGVEEVFVLGEAAGATPFSALLSPGTAPAVAIDPAEDLVVLPYSSGTTGLPKGVMLTHRNLVANLCQCEGMKSQDGFKENDVSIAVLPFFHIYGMVVVQMYVLAVGGTLVTMPRFDMEEFLATIQKYKVTLAPLVPPIVLGLAKHPLVNKYDLSSLRLIFCGAAPLGEEVAREAAARVHCRVVQGYGMTEASPVTHLSPSALPDFKLAASGWAVPNTEVMIVDTATLQPLGVGQEGELWIRGPQIMKGYLNQPKATRDSITPEGWYRTGDIGSVDAGGYFYIVDRLKELIKYKGLQVAPAELEALVLTHPAVADAAVIPSPDEEAGEVPKAFIVLRSGQQASADEIMGFVSAKVAPHKRVRRLEFIAQIPKSASGKILRRVLVEQERKARAAQG
jgi:acyl-CoA synthetase (AMP-forming)/AMP-acid ligase II